MAQFRHNFLIIQVFSTLSPVASWNTGFLWFAQPPVAWWLQLSDRYPAAGTVRTLDRLFMAGLLEQKAGLVSLASFRMKIRTRPQPERHWSTVSTDSIELMGLCRASTMY